VNKKNPLGAAAFIGPGIAKPGVSFELATETSVAKKVAVSEKIATELLDDIPGMASYIRMELAYQLRAKINTTLMTGVSSATVPAGLQTLSVAYTLTTVQTQAPGNWDCIVAAVAQLRSGNLMGPVTAFINPIDYANMKLWKAQTQGQLFNMIDSGATIIEDNNIPVGFLQVAILPYYVIKIYQDFQVAFGWEDQDFTKNLVTTIAEMRLHQYSSENYAGFAIYDTFANIQAAIAIP
jgi:HK97 family phage major capsid protein